MENQDHLCKGITKELLNLILEYDGSIHYRNGVYINRISKEDERYDILKNIPSKKYYPIPHQHETFVYFRNKTFFIGFVETSESIKFHFFRGSTSWTTYILQ
jgi:hypothetical protein